MHPDILTQTKTEQIETYTELIRAFLKKEVDRVNSKMTLPEDVRKETTKELRAARRAYINTNLALTGIKAKL